MKCETGLLQKGKNATDVETAGLMGGDLARGFEN
jgi:hypothetical protein